MHWWIARIPPFTPTPPAESSQLLCIWRLAWCILLLHKIENIKAKKYEKEGKCFQNASGVRCWPAGRPEPSRQTQAFICRTELCRQMTIFARYHCALNFSLSAIWAKIITPPSHSSNSNGSALVPILSLSSEVFRPVRKLKNGLLENASQAKFVAIFIKALIIGHLNSRAGSLSSRHYALPSALGI